MPRPEEKSKVDYAWLITIVITFFAVTGLTYIFRPRAFYLCSGGEPTEKEIKWLRKAGVIFLFIAIVRLFQLLFLWAYTR